jgi:SAM-dependent methyltransferase
MDYTGKDNLDVMSLAKNYNNFIFQWINERSYNRILDFGAGSGEYCNRISKHKIEAVEIDNSLRERLLCKSYSDIFQIENNQFDLIYSLNVLEHIEDEREVVTKLFELLKPDGTIKILVPARMEIYSKMDEKVGHFRRYNKQQLIALFEKNNFLVEECYYFDSLGYFASHLYKFMDNSGDINPKMLKLYDKIVFPLSRIIDRLGFNRLIGKNLMLVGRKNND